MKECDKKFYQERREIHPNDNLFSILNIWEDIVTEPCPMSKKKNCF